MKRFNMSRLDAKTILIEHLQSYIDMVNWSPRTPTPDDMISDEMQDIAASAARNFAKRYMNSDQHYTLITYKNGGRFAEGESLPEDTLICLWYYKGEWQEPYIGTLCDSDFPGVEEFFCWRVLPCPSTEFFNKYS
jgi:hypothetical protein